MAFLDVETPMIRLKTATFLLLLTFLCGTTAAQAQSPDPTRRPPVLRSSNSYPSREPERIATNRSGSRVSPTLVTIPAVVMDRNGRYIPNLHKEDFRIYEDGVEQDVAYFAPVEKPFTVALMLDASGSTQSQLAQLRLAANAFISQLRPDDRLLIMTFDGGIH